MIRSTGFMVYIYPWYKVPLLLSLNNQLLCTQVSILSLLIPKINLSPLEYLYIIGIGMKDMIWSDS